MIFKEYKDIAVDKKAGSNENTIVVLVDESQFEKRVGRNEKGLYEVKLSSKFPEFHYSLMDLITFNKDKGNEIILCMDRKIISEAEKEYGTHKFDDNFKRDYEREYLVHSTTEENFGKIMKERYIKSLNLVNRGKEDKDKLIPSGKKLGDPEQFSDYIMFSVKGYASEMVVASKNSDTIIQDISYKYVPGVRLYFDLEKIARDGLLIRDGIHYKVKDELPLKEYLIMAVGRRTIGINGEVSIKEFADKADEYFLKYRVSQAVDIMKL